MFERLRRALDGALSRLEGKSGAEEDVERLLAAMREELVENKARLPGLAENLEALERERKAERKRAEDCVRRAEQARTIDDGDTVEVAERFARRHLERVAVLEQRIEAARAELEFERQEAERMTVQLKDAVARKDSLAIQARRARAIDTTRGSGFEAFDAFDRAAEGVGRSDDVEAAERALDRELGLGSGGAARRRPPPDPDLDALDREGRAEELLDELKRRMGHEGEAG